MKGNEGSILRAVAAGSTIDGEELLAPTTLALKPGETIALRGANGSGKTTLLKLLAGRLTPSHGKVLLYEKQVDERRKEVRESIASLIGTPALYPDLTVIEQLTLIATTWGFKQDATREKADEMLSTFGIEKLAHRFLLELSSGQTQLYYLAATFIRPCKILLLDEPEQRLDDDRKSLLAAAMLTLKARGTAIIFATHDDVLAEQVADRIVRLES